MSRKIIGIDLGDRNSQYCVLNEAGTMLEEGSVSTTPAGFAKHFRALPPALISSGLIPRRLRRSLHLALF